MSNPGGSDEQILHGLIRGHVERIIRSVWLHNTSGPDPDSFAIAHLPMPGATDAGVFRVDVSLPVFVKMHYTDVGREATGYRALQQGPPSFTPHLVPPLAVPGEDGVLWLTPYVNAVTLHDLVCEGDVSDAWVADVYRDVLTTISDLWIETQRPHGSHLRDVYVARVNRGTDYIAAGLNISRVELNQLEIVVNGERYGTFQALWRDFEHYISRTTAPILCTTHGDEHAKNIMVFRNALGSDPRSWVLIDYVNGREASDWLFSIAKMLHWWQFYAAVELAKSDPTREAMFAARMVLGQDRLEIEYDRNALTEPVVGLRQQLEAQVWELAQRVAAEFGEDDAAWQQRLDVALFAVIFGSAYRHFRSAWFAVPIMIGESVRALRRGLPLSGSS